MNNQARITQYLDRYTLPDSRAAARLVLDHSPQRFERALCIPAFDETTDFLHGLQGHPTIGGTLVIVVINAPDSADAAALRRTRLLRQTLFALSDNSVENAQATMLQLPFRDGTFSVLVMDHCSPGRTLPQQEGVGLARKLGNDVALELWQHNRLMSPWLFQTDADATLPDHYFVTPESFTPCSAIHLNFEHVNPAGVSVAQQLYDLKLDYYTAGLAYAGSPYAHYSVGSSLVINADYYAVVRGYPKLSAGEDFHILNKLAKESCVAFDRTRTVRLIERSSERVPFGTATGVARFREMEAPGTTALYYAPDCFAALRQWLRFLEHCSQSAAGIRSFDAERRFVDFVAKDLPSDIVLKALKQLGLLLWLERTLSENSDATQARRQLKIGMDALKTLRLIHALRDNGFDNVDAVAAVKWLNAHPSEKTRLRSDGYRVIAGLKVFPE